MTRPDNLDERLLALGETTPRQLALFLADACEHSLALEREQDQTPPPAVVDAVGFIRAWGQGEPGVDTTQVNALYEEIAACGRRAVVYALAFVKCQGAREEDGSLSRPARFAACEAATEVMDRAGVLGSSLGGGGQSFDNAWHRANQTLLALLSQHEQDALDDLLAIVPIGTRSRASALAG